MSVASPQRIVLPSNSGYKSLAIDVRGSDAESLRCDVWFKSALPYLSDTEETIVSAKDLALSRTELYAFVTRIEAWLALPLDDLAVTPLEVVVDLGFAPHGSLVLDVNHPSVFITVDALGVDAEMPMSCDQSCLRLFCDAVREIEDGPGG